MVKPENWEERLEAAEAGLGAWREALTAEVAKARGARGLLARLRPPGPEELTALERDARARLGEAPLVEASAVVQGLCERFLEAGPQERAKIRARIGACDEVFALLWAFAEQSPTLLRGPGDAAALRQGLAAVSIDDGRAGTEAVERALGRLWISAARAGIDPAPHFAEVARLSNRGTAGGGAYMRETMGEFQRSTFFRREVAPRRVG